MKKILLLLFILSTIGLSQSDVITIKFDTAKAHTAGGVSRIKMRVQADSTWIFLSPIARAYTNAKIAYLNGLSDSAHTLATDTTISGSPAWSSVSSTHTLQLPFPRMKLISWITGLQDSLNDRYRRGDTASVLASKDWVSGIGGSYVTLATDQTVIGHKTFQDSLEISDPVINVPAVLRMGAGNILRLTPIGNLSADRTQYYQDADGTIALTKDSTIVSAGTYTTVTQSGHTATVNADTTKLVTTGTTQVITSPKHLTARWFGTSFALDTIIERTTDGMYLSLAPNGGGMIKINNNAHDNKVFLQFWDSLGTGTAVEGIISGRFIGQLPLLSNYVSTMDNFGIVRIKKPSDASTQITLDTAGTGTFSSTIQATTGKFTDLNSNAVPLHLSDASGLTNSALTQASGGQAMTFSDSVTLTTGHLTVTAGYLDADSLCDDGTTWRTSGSWHSGLGASSLGATTVSSLTSQGALSATTGTFSGAITGTNSTSILVAGATGTNRIHTGSSDGADANLLAISAGGTTLNTRGGNLYLYGNQHASADSGKVIVVTGFDNSVVRDFEVRLGSSSSSSLIVDGTTRSTTLGSTELVGLYDLYADEGIFAGALSATTGTFSGDVAVNGGDLTSTATTFNFLTSTVTTFNGFQAGTANTLGSTTGKTTIRNDTLMVEGDIKMQSAGQGLYIKEGTNATLGVATLSAGTVTVNTTKVTANSRIFLTIDGGTLTNVGATYVSARVAGTSFTISSTNVLDASDVAWLIIEPTTN